MQAKVKDSLMENLPVLKRLVVKKSKKKKKHKTKVISEAGDPVDPRAQIGTSSNKLCTSNPNAYFIHVIMCNNYRVLPCQQFLSPNAPHPLAENKNQEGGGEEERKKENTSLARCSSPDLGHLREALHRAECRIPTCSRRRFSRR